ncbi:MAG TPA: STAS domain-containing protein [Rubricoccaceae bacterium]|nr:STAS domain-containing protein [Rubricoccaceae bacterium]
MALSISERYNAVVATPKGEFFGSLQGPAFREEMAALRADGKKNVVLDLGETTLMDSSGVGVLIAEAEAFRAEGGDVRLARVEARVRNLFLMTRLLGEVFTLYPTVDEAVQSFSSSPASA